jgi:hypothetical protein
MDSAKFEQQEFFLVSDIATFFSGGNIPKTRLHLEKQYIHCEFPTTASGVPSLFTQENVLNAAVFYQLVGEGLMHQANAAKIVKRIPAGTWQDVRDGLTNFLIVSLTGEGDTILVFDLDYLPEPVATATLIINLQAVRNHVIERFDEIPVRSSHRGKRQ